MKSGRVSVREEHPVRNRLQNVQVSREAALILVDGTVSTLTKGVVLVVRIRIGGSLAF